jgi:hypothetical protein
MVPVNCPHQTTTEYKYLAVNLATNINPIDVP